MHFAGFRKDRDNHSLLQLYADILAHDTVTKLGVKLRRSGDYATCSFSSGAVMTLRESGRVRPRSRGSPATPAA